VEIILVEKLASVQFEVFRKKGRADEARPGKEKQMAVSTSYGGMTRVRFGGFLPCGGKSQLLDDEAPLSCA
jgi:hypothetical protein